jgi:hypothetical protein
MVYVGMDVHRKRTQVAVMDEGGEELSNRNFCNDPAEFVPMLMTLERLPFRVDVIQTDIQTQSRSIILGSGGRRDEDWRDRRPPAVVA